VEKNKIRALTSCVRFFSKIIEQPRVNPEIFKYALEPNPVKLSGPENYVSWV
jgi:hypothetical protein